MLLDKHLKLKGLNKNKYGEPEAEKKPEGHR